MQSLAEMAEFAYVTALAAGECDPAAFPACRSTSRTRIASAATIRSPSPIARPRPRSARRSPRAFPTHGVFGEEHGRESGTEPWTWVIDPIDGTKSFILGQLHWGTLIALNDGTRPVVGVAYQPFVGEAFVAYAGGSAQWRRGNRAAHAGDTTVCATRATHSSSPPILATSRPPREAAAFAAVTEGARFTRYGGDLYCYTQLAMGLCDVVIETGLQPYDVQALIPLIEAAGGVISDWQGERVRRRR